MQNIEVGTLTVDELLDRLDGADFRSEKDACNYFEKHISSFIRAMYGVEYARHIREYHFGVLGTNEGLKDSKRVDFVVETKCGKRIILEFKHPKSPSIELMQGIGQLMGYGTLLKTLGETFDEIGLVTTKIDHITPYCIVDYALPIGLFVMSKDTLVSCKLTKIDNGSAKKGIL